MCHFSVLLSVVLDGIAVVKGHQFLPAMALEALIDSQLQEAACSEDSGTILYQLAQQLEHLKLIRS